jgi:hypothetical protein
VVYVSVKERFRFLGVLSLICPVRKSTPFLTS